MNKKKVKIFSAPLPEEIMWKNHHILYKKKFVNRVLVWLSTFFLLFLGEGLVVLILLFWFSKVKDIGDDI
jgi:hypothetical protein